MCVTARLGFQSRAAPNKQSLDAAEACFSRSGRPDVSGLIRAAASTQLFGRYSGSATSTEQHPLGEMPLIVLTRGIPEADDLNKKTLEENRRDHAAIAAMSRNGKLVIAAHSGHHIQLDEPELVIKSIHEILVAARK